jgi:hypothetical protein
MTEQPMGGFIALAAIVAAMVVYRVVWFLRREKARKIKQSHRRTQI